jgi:chemotaxis protein methyltransferase WspC
MGIIHMARQDMNGAEDCFRKALYLDPGHYESLVHVSLIYRQKGDERKAALYRERAERKAGRKGKIMESSPTLSTIKAAEHFRIRTD